MQSATDEGSVRLPQKRPSRRASTICREGPMSPIAYQFIRVTAGGFQLSSRISVLGQYARMYSENSSFGAGTQLDSLSAPGDSFWKWSVREPSALYLSDLLLV